MTEYLFGDVTKNKPYGSKRKFNENKELILENLYNSKGKLVLKIKFSYKHIGKNVTIITESCKWIRKNELYKRVFRVDRQRRTEKEYRYSSDGKKGLCVKRYFNEEGDLVKELEYFGKEYKGTTYHIDQNGNFIRPYFVSAWLEKNFNGIISDSGTFKLHKSVEPTELF